MTVVHEEVYRDRAVKIVRHGPFQDYESWEVYEGGKKVKFSGYSYELGSTGALTAEARQYIDWLDEIEEDERLEQLARRQEEYLFAAATLLTRAGFLIEVIGGREDMPIEWETFKMAYYAAKKKLKAIAGGDNT